MLGQLADDRYRPASIEVRSRLMGRTDRDRAGELPTRITIGRARTAS